MRRLRPTAPVIRGTAQNPDVFFQGREAANRYYDAVPGIVAELSRRARRTHRAPLPARRLPGPPEAERVVVIMGSGTGRGRGSGRRARRARGERVGVLTVRLFRPFPVDAFWPRSRRPRAASLCWIARRSPGAR